MGADFGNLRVLSLESRRSREMAHLIANYGGQPTVVASTREVASGPNADAAEFAAGLLDGKFSVVIFMTGVGMRALAKAIDETCPLDKLAAALSKVAVVARGPKPMSVLREWGVPVSLAAPEPNTWRELLQVLDRNKEQIRLKGANVAVQEHGSASVELYAGLQERGAVVWAVPVYKWELPEDTGPLKEAIRTLASGNFDVVLFTSSVQVHHLFRFSDEIGQHRDVGEGLRRAVIGSIGPVTSETLREFGIAPDLEPSHPKMGFLVKEVAENSSSLLRRKR